MKKYTIYFSIAAVSIFTACQSGNPELENATTIKDRSEQQVVTGGKPSDDLKANAISEGDIAGQVKWSLGRVQEELRNSKGSVVGLGEVTVLVDDNFQMVIKNEFEGDVYEKRVGLSNLDIDVKKLQIVRDNGDDIPNPGFKIPVLEGKPGVEIYKNGSKQETVKELEILLGERRQVQLVVSALTQAVKAIGNE